MAKVSVLVPHNPRSEWEEVVFAFTMERWLDKFPEWDFHVGGLSEWSGRSAARNEAASRAVGDIFVICDADTTFFSAAEVQAMVSGVEKDHRRWYLPQHYLQTTEEWTNEVLNGCSIQDFLRWTRKYEDQPGGWQVCHRSAFERVGGFDEGFCGWGYEDTAFVAAMTALVGAPRRFGTALHLWHPTSRSERQEQPQISHNAHRFMRYKAAAEQGPARMEALLHLLAFEERSWP